MVFSHSGVAGPDCVFMTAATPNPAIWFITRHEPEHGHVEMPKVVPEMTACKPSIRLAATNAGCDATITYSQTSLVYGQFMREGETRMNRFLKTGRRLAA